MKKKKKQKHFPKRNSFQKNSDKEKRPFASLPEEAKRRIGGVVFFLLAIIVALSFIQQAGRAGEMIFSTISFLFGKTVFILPLILVFGGLVFIKTKYKNFLFAELLAIFLLILGISGILTNWSNWSNGTNLANGAALAKKGGGWLGYSIGRPIFQLFGFWVSQIIFLSLILISGLIFWNLLKRPDLSRSAPKEKAKEEEKKEEKTPSLIKRIFTQPSFKVKPLEPEIAKSPEVFSIKKEETGKVELKEIPLKTDIEYQRPSLDLLASDREKPTAGDIRNNAAIIKKTLENFEIPVEMGQINVGPTVTQYTLKPAEGIKLSKITGLSNDLALALAAHPIRIEAPIPGKSLVGIEVPNKIRAQVRLRDLISGFEFQNAPSNLTIVLGKDVSGIPVYADLARMPHLLVAGSTGTGKTIFLNTLILSLIYRNSPEFLRFILIDPKRVEFSVYNELPHLLSPVIFDAQQSINVLKWLISEMERRFGVLSTNGSRDLVSYNQKNLKIGEPTIPYIVLIVDELADLMAARGREMEAGIVRLAQMARAVGIHLVLATQRPSVEVITGLIKANITSRVTFQVASQVDSRTVLDVAGAEKLLGAGDMLFLSAEIAKPKRIQGAYVSEKEVKKVINWLQSKVVPPSPPIDLSSLEESLNEKPSELSFETGEEDPLYEEAKRIVIEAKKASASLLQRKLKIGYARAARLIDMLEERGVVGPGEGAKPRKVYFPRENNENDENDDWQKI